MKTKPTNSHKMGLNATWSMAVGGMVGGGIFSVLGVVVFLAGKWAWLSFLIAGLIALATIAAAFSTGSAINATLFATARLMHEVAKDRELPPVLCHRNKNDVPDRPVMIIGAIGAFLAVIGTLSTLVEAASLAFLFTFAVVDFIALFQCKKNRWIFAFGGVGACFASVVLVGRLIFEAPVALMLLAVIGMVATFGRPRINQLTEGLHEKQGSG